MRIRFSDAGAYDKSLYNHCDKINIYDTMLVPTARPESRRVARMARMWWSSAQAKGAAELPLTRRRRMAAARSAATRMVRTTVVRFMGGSVPGWGGERRGGGSDPPAPSGRVGYVFEAGEGHDEPRGNSQGRKNPHRRCRAPGHPPAGCGRVKARAFLRLGDSLRLPPNVPRPLETPRGRKVL